jgi:hypothetical protein
MATRSSTAAVVTVVTAATVSVGGMRPFVLVAFGRRPVVPGVRRVGSGDMVELLAGKIRPQGLAASTSSRFVVRGRGGIDDWRGWGTSLGVTMRGVRV